MGDPCLDGWDGVECDEGRTQIVTLDLEGCDLQGAVSNELLDRLGGLDSLVNLKLADNRLNAQWPREFVRFVDARCSEAGRCSGLAPYACSAFGEWARLKIDDPSECDACDGSMAPTIALLVSTLILCLGLLVVYVIIILRYPEALRRWLSFAIILVNHTQTLSILGSLDLAWPPSVRTRATPHDAPIPGRTPRIRCTARAVALRAARCRCA